MSTANISSKKCFKCENTLPRTEFYKHPSMKDGLLGKCKSCTKADANAHRLANLDKIRQYDRERAKNPDRAATARIISQEWRQADKRRVKAHQAVCYAVRRGLLTKQPCVVCGSEKSMAHHESYDRPLDVVWYCQVHHKARHKQMAIDGIET